MSDTVQAINMGSGTAEAPSVSGPNYFVFNGVQLIGISTERRMNPNEVGVVITSVPAPDVAQTVVLSPDNPVAEITLDLDYTVPLGAAGSVNVPSAFFTAQLTPPGLAVNAGVGILPRLVNGDSTVVLPEMGGGWIIRI